MNLLRAQRLSLEFVRCGTRCNRLIHLKSIRNVGHLSKEPWVNKLPAKVRPFLYLARVDKPIGTLLLFYPCGKYPKCSFELLEVSVAWSITMASYALELPPSYPLTYTALFGIGAFIMRGAGCTINDMWDKNLDKAVGEPLVYVRRFQDTTG